MTDAPLGGITADLTVHEALKGASSFLDSHGDPSPDISARWVVGAAVGHDPGQLALVADCVLGEDAAREMDSMLERRASGEPLQYICGHAPFRRLDMISRPGVFIPRPETEVLVQEAIDALSDSARQHPGEGLLIADPCCGSGTICVSLALEIPGCRVVATDISEDACALTRDNAALAGVADRVEVLHGSLLEPLRCKKLDAIVSNPPYIPTSKIASMSHEVVGFEPMAALDGGEDGLDLYREILSQARSLMASGGFLAFELDEETLEAAALHARGLSWIDPGSVRVVRDLAGRDRILTVRCL